MALYGQQQGDNSELRKKRRKKEQIQAFGILAGALVVVIILIVGIASGVNALLGSGSKDKKAETVVKEIDESETADTKGDEKTAETEENIDEKNVEETDVGETEGSEVSSNVIDETEQENVSQDLVEDTGVMAEDRKEQILDSYVQNILGTLTLEEKIGQMFLVTSQNITGVADAKQAGSSTSAAINEYAIGGILYDENNMESKEQLTLMIQNTKSFGKLEMFFAVSDEGGEDSPLTLGGVRETALLSQSDVAAGEISEAYSVGISKSSEFRNLEINLNLAPMTDVVTNTGSSVASRAYGNSVTDVLSLTKSEMKGMIDQGVNCCVKYFPGQGDVTGDTKTTRVTSQRTKEQLDQTEGVIYKELIEEDVPMIMVSHVTMPKVTGDNMPSSLSSVIVTDILRNEYGFQGVIITDYMNKNAITRFYKHADASVMAVQAGVDMIVAPGDFKKSYSGLLQAVKDGEITEERINESVVRILKMKYKDIIDYENTTVTEQ